MRGALWMVPFRVLARRWELLDANDPKEPSLEELGIARRVGRLVQGVARRMPFTCNCLPQAIVGKRLLARYGISSELKLGVNDVRAEDFTAHAWLVCGSVYVTGYLSGEGEYKVLD
ncbi:lasso peptide biosynthesis B2 protein [Pelagicoccus mobilis]|uniref:Lasso peptide biosynthesis B2 protein n=1 Tax=Pelagicoccus mobilis TaxID=415221 RepID=A0A934RVN4_9BACT|nr:lasso peptide biosynthesis B2 protein [Pelagicoccus mobilis]